MSESLPPYLAKAQRAIDIARRLSESGDYDFAAGRAYYAMFYVAEALLWTRGRAFSKHSAVHAAFGENFAKPKALDPKFHRYLLNAFEKRIEGDYQADSMIDGADVRAMILHAEEFLSAARTYLEQETEQEPERGE